MLKLCKARQEVHDGGRGRSIKWEEKEKITVVKKTTDFTEIHFSRKKQDFKF